jgi:hypothetical protein
MQRGDDVDAAGSAGESIAFSTRSPRKDMRVKPSRLARPRELLDEFRARLDAVDVATCRCLKKRS